MYKLRRPKPIPGIELPGRLEWVVDALFPPPPAFVRAPLDSDNSIIAQPFTVDEIVEAAKGLPNRKAPGPDGVNNELLKAAVCANPRRFLSTFNKCPAEVVFPAPWKTGKLVLLHKHVKPLDFPSAYRPICLFNGFGGSSWRS